MALTENCIWVLTGEKTIINYIKPYISRDISVFVIINYSKIRYALQKSYIKCLIACINNNVLAVEKEITCLKELFPDIPMIAFIKNPDIEIARKCGEVGFNMVISDNNLSNINHHVQELTIQQKVSLVDLKIKLQQYPELIQKALQYIEKNYISLLDVKEVTDYLGVCDCYLPIEFKKNNLFSPKRMIMYFKIKHSLKLLNNPRYKIKEIASLSGFSDPRRYNECFQKVFNVSPNEYKLLIKSNSQKASYFETFFYQINL